MSGRRLGISAGEVRTGSIEPKSTTPVITERGTSEACPEAEVSNGILAEERSPAEVKSMAAIRSEEHDDRVPCDE